MHCCLRKICYAKPAKSTAFDPRLNADLQHRYFSVLNSAVR